MTPLPLASEALLVRYSWLARRHITICLNRLGCNMTVYLAGQFVKTNPFLWFCLCTRSS